LCDFQKAITPECSTCGGAEFFVGGVGTKEIETQILERFPEARVARLDRDVTQSKKALPRILGDFAAGKIDILVGTQMISKGIDIAGLSMVGVILADQGWGMPDFRAMERSYQVLKQILGRAGRRGQSSRFLIQTLSPTHPIFEYLSGERTEDFLKEEMKVREMAKLPPFSRALLWTLSDADLGKVTEASEALLGRISQVAKSLGIQLLGPVPAPIERIKGEYRFQILAKAGLQCALTPFLQSVLDDMEKRSLGVKVRVERDPYQFL
jgi:primosomal protein N' (replication factor Y)